MSAPKVLTKTYNDGVFNISEHTGYLPLRDPDLKLPDEFKDLQHIIDNLPAILNEEGEITKYVTALPNYEEAVKQVKDPMTLQALFRSYAFVASGYLLEPSHHYNKKHGRYGKAKTLLPANVARPYVQVAEKLDVFPWLDYHYAYSLGNYKRKDNNKDLTWDNLDMCAKFSGTSDEIGFIMIHVDINRYGKNIISSIKKVLSGKVQEGLEENYHAIHQINKVRVEMWKASNHKNYNDFRVFIMGITGNTELFGEGVVYEGCYDNKPQNFRGQSGSQDDIIPTEDIFSGVVNYYLDNQLTRFLLDMRQYRPKVVQEFLIDLKEDCSNVHEIVKKEGSNALLELLKIVEQIYFFRNGHWQFVQKYIMANTAYQIATGGTPITTWIPNQIEACLQYMKILMKEISPQELKPENLESFNRIQQEHTKYVHVLTKQIEELRKANYDAKLVYDLNEDLAELR